MEKLIESNQAVLGGEIINGFKFGYECYGERFYVAHLKVKRLSGIEDIIPITVSNRLIPVEEDWTGQFVSVTGQFHSYNKYDEDKSRLILSVFARKIEHLIEDESVSKNRIDLDGYLCKEPVYRKTALGREIANLFVAVNRPYGKSDYIPCICWGRNARYVSGLGIGTRVKISGRIQSRKYLKKISDTETEERTAYEVSVSTVEVDEENY